MNLENMTRSVRNQTQKGSLYDSTCKEVPGRGKSIETGSRLMIRGTQGMGSNCLMGTGLPLRVIKMWN